MTHSLHLHSSLLPPPPPLPLSLSVPPEYETRDPVNAKEGDQDLVVIIPLSSRPDPDFQWTLNGERIEDSSTRTLTASSVSLSPVSREDNGTYAVTGTNSAGSGEGSFNLFITCKHYDHTACLPACLPACLSVCLSVLLA